MANPALHIETLALQAWPAEVVQPLDGWQLRSDPVGSRRVNSVWPNRTDGKVPLEEKLIRVEAFYQRRGQPARYQISPACVPADLVETLDGRGYQIVAKTAVQTAPTTTVLARTPSTVRPRCTTTLSDLWLETYASGEGLDPRTLEARRAILLRIQPLAVYVTLFSEETPVAVGRGVLEGEWMGIFSMVTLSGYRRRGMATAVLHALAGWAANRGASRLYLQVMENNPAARELYGKAGFQTRYHYHYRQYNGSRLDRTRGS